MTAKLLAYLSLAVAWATDTHREQLMNRFWLELPAREKSAVVRGPAIPSICAR